jgi:Zn-dependent protease with chaperone function
MDISPFKNLVKQLDIDADHAADIYKKKIINISLIGKAFTWSIPACLLIGCLLAHWIASQLNSLIGGIFFLALLFLAARLWLLLVFTPEPPQGHWLDEETAPRLFSLISKISRKVGAPPLAGVLLDEAFRLEIRQQARLGILGKHQHYLLIGLPYLQSLSANQFQAALVHELAIYSNRRDGIFLQRQHWIQLYPRLSQARDRLERWLARFPLWFIPYFNACTLPHARRQALRADRTAAKMTGASTVMHALCRARLAQCYLEEIYWPRIMARAEQTSQIREIHPYADLRQEMGQDDQADFWKPWLHQIAARETRFDDEKPALADRLKVLHEKASLVRNPTQSAAEYLLGDLYGRITKEFDDAWQAEMRDEWETCHRKLREARTLVGELSWRPAAELDPGTRMRYASALLTLGDRERGLPMAIELAENGEGQGEGAWIAAQALLAMKDERALRYLEMVIRDSDFLGKTAAEQAMHHYARQGQHDRAAYFQSRLIELQTAY